MPAISHFPTGADVEIGLHCRRARVGRKGSLSVSARGDIAESELSGWAR